MRIDSADYQMGTLLLNSDDADDIIRWLDDFVPGEYDIVKHRNKRSLSANAYLWHLCEEIAKRTGTTKIQVYRNAIKSVGVYEQLKMEPKAMVEFASAVAAFGIGYIVEPVDAEGDMVLVNYYKGSSEYDSKEFARLVDFVVDDAVELGVPVKDSGVTRAKSEWNA